MHYADDLDHLLLPDRYLGRRKLVFKLEQIAVRFPVVGMLQEVVFNHGALVRLIRVNVGVPQGLEGDLLAVALHEFGDQDAPGASLKFRRLLVLHEINPNLRL